MKGNNFIGARQTNRTRCGCLARIYGVETRVLNQAVKRNRERFPPEFMFQLAVEEVAQSTALRSQSVILKKCPEIGFHVKEDSIPYRTRRKVVRLMNAQQGGIKSALDAVRVSIVAAAKKGQ